MVDSVRSSRVLVTVTPVGLLSLEFLLGGGVIASLALNGDAVCGIFGGLPRLGRSWRW